MHTDIKLNPTPEQVEALRLFATGDDLVVEAGAGTGKTTTLQLLAESAPDRRGRYLAFNKAIVEEAKRKMPRSVEVSTAHSLAFRAVARPFAHRLRSGRMRSAEIARTLRIQPMTVQVDNLGHKSLSDAYLGGLAMRAITSFCQSADDVPTRRHVPYVDGIDLPTSDGRRTFSNNRAVAAALEPALVRAWADLTDPAGVLPYKHDHYLKLYERSSPRIDVDFLMFDEAQDVNPVLASIVSQQTCQVVWVGDSNQQIYEWMGAVNALAALDGTARSFLSTSFRFGPTLADLANGVLTDLDSELRLTGVGGPTTIGPVPEADVVLCRTNARAIETLLDVLEEGRRAHLVGGAAQVASFAEAAQDLMRGKRTYHPELACFDSWGEVESYVKNDAQGGELRLLVDLIEKFTVEVVLEACRSSVPEDQADVVISTAHKAKGREWNRAKLADDFTRKDEDDDTLPEPAELRLLYVAITRGRFAVDVSDVRYFTPKPATPVAT